MSWTGIRDISEHTWGNEGHMDLRNPDVLDATAWQRRHVWTWISGGLESALYKSTDDGANWGGIDSVLPDGDILRIGLCIPPADPAMSTPWLSQRRQGR